MFPMQHAARITAIAELPNIAAIRRPIVMSGHAASVSPTPPAASRTPTLATTSFREHTQADRMMMIAPGS